jgi:hypothetical protein
MPRNQLILRLSDDWAILADRNQWMVTKFMRSRSPGIGKEGYWKPLSYVGSTKTVLSRCFREYGVLVTPQARAVIDTWPERFLDWLAEVNERGKLEEKKVD